MAKTAYEQLLDLLGDDPDTKSKVQAKLTANPCLIAEDKFMTDLFGIYKGVESGEPTTTTVPAAAAATTAAVHTPTVPGTASAAATTTAAPTTATPSADSAAILAALNSLKTSVDDRLKNVITKDEVNTLGANLINQAATQALRQADEIFTIRDTYRREFNKDFDRPAFEKFVTDAVDPVTKRNRYATLTDAFNAMVAQDRVKAEIAKGVAEGVKQVESARTVPGQTTSTALSPAQQVMAKAKAATNSEGKTATQAAIDKLAALERSREMATVQ
jgi:hypothetical protein